MTTPPAALLAAALFFCAAPLPAAGPAPAASPVTMSDQHAWLAHAQQRLSALETLIAHIHDEAMLLDPAERRIALREVTRLRMRADQLRTALVELRHAGSGEWAGGRDQVETALDDLQIAVRAGLMAMGEVTPL